MRTIIYFLILISSTFNQSLAQDKTMDIVSHFETFYKEYKCERTYSKEKISLNFTDKLKGYFITKIEIPLTNYVFIDANMILKGDMNKDGISDELISVYEATGTIETLHFFLYSKSKVHYLTNDWSISNNICSLRPQEIKNNKIVFRTYCKEFSNNYGNSSYSIKDNKLVNY